MTETTALHKLLATKSAELLRVTAKLVELNTGLSHFKSQCAAEDTICEGLRSVA